MLSLPKKSVTVLGVHDGHDAGAALIRDGKVLAALQEERCARWVSLELLFKR